MPAEAGPRGRRYSGEGSGGFAQTLGVDSANGNQAYKADAKRARFRGKAGRNCRQRGATATGIPAAAHHAGVDIGRWRARGVLSRGLGLDNPVRSGDFRRGNRMRVARRRAMRVITVRLMMRIRPVSMTAMGVGGDRRELDDDQKDRRPNHPQKRSGRCHAQLLLYDPGQGNKRRERRMKLR